VTHIEKFTYKQSMKKGIPFDTPLEPCIFAQLIDFEVLCICKHCV